ncbi:signal peptide peptidase-like 3-like [Planoprotostelium fungivorum]|uniref:Signal peptide peptidase-like 3-like n=1 Tax=Planoprotostelium fungivorum TaxID=1890364 RepID=A0A2P6NI49_9EUKA|nr:signal peptide peptidase-like 3-like [Planoprotostelium fungivorum]
MWYFDLQITCTVVTAAIAVWYSSQKAVSLDHIFLSDPDDNTTISTSLALILPLISSVGLLLMVYYDFVAQIALLTSLVTAATGLYLLSGSLIPPGHDLSRFSMMNILRITVITTLEVSWLITGAWVLNNVMALGICVTSILFIRLNHLKTTSLLLAGLFLYDIFWVFLSPYVFASNMMVDAASKSAENPSVAAAEMLHVPVSWIAYRLSPPAKFEFPPMVLGLGDVVIPGAVVAYCLRVDTKWGTRYFRVSFFGYLFGLISTMYIADIFNAAQPALLYIVPSLLGSIVYRAHKRGELKQLLKESTDEMIALPVITKTS